MRVCAAATAVVALAAAAAPALAAPPPPFWGPTWTAPFLQTITLIPGLIVFTDNVTWFYDSTTTPVGSSLYQHGTGQFDELCTGVVRGAAGRGLGGKETSRATVATKCVHTF